MIDVLRKIIEGQGAERIALVRQFQSMVWESEGTIENEQLDEIFRALAYDLDFCETDEALEREVQSALHQLESIPE